MVYANILLFQNEKQIFNCKQVSVLRTSADSAQMKSVTVCAREGIFNYNTL